MAKEFNMQINKNLLNTNVPRNPRADDETMTQTMRTADEIMNVFEKNKTSMEEAYLILLSLADSIYMYSISSEEI